MRGWRQLLAGDEEQADHTAGAGTCHHCEHPLVHFPLYLVLQMHTRMAAKVAVTSRTFPDIRWDSSACFFVLCKVSGDTREEELLEGFH